MLYRSSHSLCRRHFSQYQLCWGDDWEMVTAVSCSQVVASFPDSPPQALPAKEGESLGTRLVRWLALSLT